MNDFNLGSYEEELAEINKLKGEERALDLFYLINYVKEKEGEEGFEKLQEKLQSLGFELPELTSSQKMEWIPMKIPVFFMTASAKFFSWNRDDVINMGKDFVAFSPLLKIFIKYFVSKKKTLEAAIRNWQKHFTTGELRLVSFDKDKKKAELELTNFVTRPIEYIFLKGAFEKMSEIALGFKNVKVEVKKGFLKGKDYHRFIFRWE